MPADMNQTQRKKDLNRWLGDVLHGDPYSLSPASADASFRNYLRVSVGDEQLILMDAPPEHEDCEPFVDVSQRLIRCSLNVPRVYAYDLEQGFVLMSDLGDEHYLQMLNPATVGQLYADAIGALIHMQQRTASKALPHYDHSMLMREMLLFREWLVEDYLSIKLDDQSAQMLDDSFELLAQQALAQPKVFVHRDYHSRNLMYCEAMNPGILDFQDAVLGPLTYDLVSLLKDCYIRWPRDLIQQFALAYFEQAVASDLIQDWQAGDFLRAFDLMGVQRHLKASGIFARLFLRDGKQGYLADIPRTLGYIAELEGDYAELQPLIDFINKDCLPRLQNKLETL